MMSTEFYVKAIEGRKSELESSKWLAQFYKQLDSVTTGCDEIRCLALGSFTEFLNPRFQLALLLLISQHVGCQRISVWDPVFVDEDRSVLNHYGIEVSDNFKSSGNCLWYVPHGPFSLVLTLPLEIGDEVYIGNDLGVFDMSDRPNREDVEQYKKESRILPIETSSKDRWFSAFSTTAIHRRIKGK